MNTQQDRSKETVLITGASSGIGRALANAFAANGYHLVLTARNREALTALADQLQQSYQTRCQVVVQDLAQPDGVMQLCGQLESLQAQVDVLVNNAGLGFVGAASQLAIEEQMQIVQVNVVAFTELTLRLLPAMITRDRGSILTVASTAAFQPGPYMAVYFASKAFVLSLTEAVAEETRDKNVQVSCLCPGPTDTPFLPKSGVDRSLLARLGTMSADQVANHAVRRMRRGQTVIVPGMANNISRRLASLLPRRWVRAISGKIMRPK